MANKERRSFFRINSEIVLSFHSVDSYTLSQGTPEDEFPEDQKTLDVFNEIRRLDKDAAAYLSAVTEQHRVIAEYLKLLNKKIDLIAHQALASEYVSKEVRPTHVNLSEGGLAFNSAKSIYKDSTLALRIMFMSDYSNISVFARVVRCEAREDESEGYRVACEFIDIEATKQEALAKHIMRAQLQAKRQQSN